MAVEVSSKVSKESLKDIRELEDKISRFKSGDLDEERFKSYRLTRGVYGQRQFGVQMFRIKIPFGRITTDQLIAMAHTSHKWATGNLHLTTRQNIQYHHVKLTDSPNVWAELEAAGVTGREACGNTVRTITGSSKAGIDPREPFDISPYVHAMSYYFLRNPICQEMGRKVKMAFSSSEDDTAFTFMHDLGFFPIIKNGQKGFKVVCGGGLGAQAMMARTVEEFLEEDQLIPFTEACIRVFDRYGEREKRHKARLKFLVEDKKGSLGLENFLQLVGEERKAIKNQSFKVDAENWKESPAPDTANLESIDLTNDIDFAFFKKTNVFEQKQKGFFAVQVKVQLGDIQWDKAIAFAEVVKKFAADDIRITMNQGFLLRNVTNNALTHLYLELKKLGLATGGFHTIADVTACPGTDTCNLGVTNSTQLAIVLEDLVQKEYRDLITDSDIKIKMSGCMNACGQHMAAQIGFHGSSIKSGVLVIPAQQVILGGGNNPDGEHFIGDKIIKLPTKRIPSALRILLEDFKSNRNGGEYYNNYFTRTDKKHFYDILKPLADVSEVDPDEYKDWGQEEEYIQEIGVGECAGVSVDVIGAIVKDAEEKASFAVEALDSAHPADAIYRAYSVFIVGAKALLLSEDVKCNTQINILEDFNTHFVDTNRVSVGGNFTEYVLRIKNNEPTDVFAKQYVRDALAFIELVKVVRQQQVEQDKKQIDKLVIENYYKA